ncbi:MAG TPA: methyltransferase, TIGR04325 family [Acidobacteriaceae bacterium]|nr:methyltransferase, TIGR04325 family [Terriglobia bacterium]HVC91676.1 methyltransferase, TIGR04325 family [Acidobacteriaceae bacterium]
MSLTSLAKILLCRTRVGTACKMLPWAERGVERYTLSRKNETGIFTGVFSTYEEAQSHIPPSYRIGWDNQESSRLWLTHYDMIQPTAYSTFFWIQTILKENDSVVDYGGSIGLSYYGYTERTSLPQGVTWNIVEVPKIAEAGRHLAEKNHAAGLVFYDELRQAPPAKLFFSAGTIQYIRDGVPGCLEKLASLPLHVIINKVPLTDRTPSFWTIQNFGPAISSYRVYNRSEFLGYFKDFGYEVVDSWEVPDLSCDIPFHPQHTILRMGGLYFRRSE